MKEVYQTKNFSSRSLTSLNFKERALEAQLLGLAS